MTERPILFSSAMVRAILDGQKTQTRRIVKPTQSTPRVAPLTMEPWLVEMSDGSFDRELDPRGLPCWIGTHPDYPSGEKWFSCPYGAPGDTLWVRETWAAGYPGTPDSVLYRATYEGGATHQWRPSIHMPRWASRLSLRITEVRVERLHDMPWQDVEKEGIPSYTVARGVLADNPPDARWAYIKVWNEINAKRGYGWGVNPWVWVLGFEVLP